MLDKAISIARQGEMLKKQQPIVRIQQQQEAVSIENVDTKKRLHTKRGSNLVPRPPRLGDTRKALQCSRCGRSPPHPKHSAQHKKLCVESAPRKDVSKQCAAQEELWEQSIGRARMTYFLEQ